MSVAVSFTVNKTPVPGEVVYIVGNAVSLGSWNPHKAVPLNKICSNQWTCTVNLNHNASCKYRYFVGKICQQKRCSRDDEVCLDVIRWETHKVPRHVTTGQEEKLSVPTADFGDIGGVCSVGKGWLSNSSEVHIRLHGNPITLLSSDQDSKMLMVRCRPVNYTQPSHCEDPAEACDKTAVLVSKLTTKDRHPSPQGPFGVAVLKEDFVTFRHRSPTPQQLSFELDIFGASEEEEEDPGMMAPTLIGTAHLLPHNHPDSQHDVNLPIIGIHSRPIGAINVDILVTRPLPGMTFDMERCDQGYWDWHRPNQTSLDIGHRGMGPSFSVANKHKENTLESFNAAFKHGADFIETDVLLCKDGCPVIFHDFAVNTALKSRRDQDGTDGTHEVMVQDLTLDQLKSKKFFTPKGTEITDLDTAKTETDLFPTLVELLTGVDEGLGYNLEFKYPQMNVINELEAKNFLDMNTFLDTILKTLFEHAKGRRIVFSTFQPDVCVMLSLKQSVYPVMFLSQGPTEMYTWYKDSRAITFSSGINFAVQEQILGLVLHTEVVLKDLAVIDQVLKEQLLLFLWGEHNNSTDVICQMRKSGVDGVIYDRMDVYKPENAGRTCSNGDTSADISSSNNNNEHPIKKLKYEQES